MFTQTFADLRCSKIKRVVTVPERFADCESQSLCAWSISSFSSPVKCQGGVIVPAAYGYFAGPMLAQFEGIRQQIHWSISRAAQ
jgi:hypothetical protein